MKMEREKTGSQIRPRGTITHLWAATASRKIRSESYFFLYHHFSPAVISMMFGALKPTAALHLSTSLLPIWRQSDRKRKLACELRRKEKRPWEGQSKANEWCSDFLIDHFMWLKKGKKNWSLSQELGHLNIWELCICTFRPANVPIKVMLLCVDSCAYIRPVIRGNSRDKYIHNVKHKARKKNRISWVLLFIIKL